PDNQRNSTLKHKPPGEVIDLLLIPHSGNSLSTYISRRQVFYCLFRICELFLQKTSVLCNFTGGTIRLTDKETNKKT
ncbi:hypothetical protein, partial [Bacteroides heparinolyticus]|uniref:hypothetical protein n=1 Tax=Prevotella heparinolytica TaxID=28113 RepID=UPI00359F4AC9